MTKKITPDMTGCWLEGHHGWHNTYEVIGLAQKRGFQLDAEDEAYIQKWKRWRGGDMSHLESVTFEDEDGSDWMDGQGGLVEKATEYLDSLAPDGFAFNWDMGELSLLCLCQIEGTEENEALMKTHNNQCATCEQRWGK